MSTAICINCGCGAHGIRCRCGCDNYEADTAPRNPRQRSEVRLAPDPPPYPHHWTPAQRLTAYWFCVRNDCFPAYESGWEALLARAVASGMHVAEVRAKATAPPTRAQAVREARARLDERLDRG